MHPLKRYLEEVCEPVQAFAARVGTSRQTLYRVFNGAHAPKPALARRIVEATGGAVDFEALYGRAEGGADIVVVERRRASDGGFDAGKLAIAIAVVCHHVLPDGVAAPPERTFALAAEAVINTYTALTAVTTREGTDRLEQALRPVLEEVLSETLTTPLGPSVLHRATDLATQLYYHSADVSQNG